MTAACSNQHNFAHQAMAATFEIFVAGADAVYARQAAAAAFDELDILENHLSRFIESSDLSRINRLARDASTVVALDTFRCLRIAEELRRNTGGAFDIAYRSTSPTAKTGSVELTERGCKVRVLADGVQLDLGGIGKGFALDRLAALLREWEIENALLQASTSTLLALGQEKGTGPICAKHPLGRSGKLDLSPFPPSGWPVDFGPQRDRRRVLLNGTAFSASGTSVKGDHVVDPRTGRPAAGPKRCWAGAPTAAEADALSTAFMVMSEEEIRAYCSRHPGVSAFALQSKTSRMTAIGLPEQR